MFAIVVTACETGDDPAGLADQQDPSATAPPAPTPVGATPEADDHRIDIAVRGGEPKGGVRTEAVEVGARVVLVITSDIADEVHVHGYDLVVALGPGEPTTLTFAADKPGIWEVELHDAGNLLLELQVG